MLSQQIYISHTLVMLWAQVGVTLLQKTECRAMINIHTHSLLNIGKLKGEPSHRNGL